MPQPRKRQLVVDGSRQFLRERFDGRGGFFIAGAPQGLGLDIEHGEVGLEPVRQVRGACPGKGDRGLLGVEQAVHLLDERQHLGRVPAVEALGAPGAHGVDPPPDMSERQQAEGHLQPGGEHEHDREDDEVADQVRAEGRIRRIEAARRLGHHDLERSWPPGRGVEDQEARRRDRPTSGGVGNVIEARGALARRGLRQLQRLVPQGARGQDGPRARVADLPVEPAQGLFEAGIGHGLGEPQRRGVGIDQGDESVELGADVVAQRFFHMVRKQRRDRKARHEQGQCDPQRRSEQQPQAKRRLPHDCSLPMM